MSTVPLEKQGVALTEEHRRWARVRADYHWQRLAPLTPQERLDYIEDVFAQSEYVAGALRAKPDIWWEAMHGNPTFVLLKGADKLAENQRRPVVERRGRTWKRCGKTPEHRGGGVAKRQNSCCNIR